MKTLRALLVWQVLVLCLSSLSFSAEVFIHAGSKSEWKYFDGGTIPSPDWMKPEFDDSSWKKGPAPLGYNDDLLKTEISFGPNANSKFMTAYFRHEFQVKDPGTIKSMSLLVRFDDAVAIYLNGKELARTNLPPGQLNFDTRAIRKIEQEEELWYHRLAAGPELLRPGRNVLALELHQDSPGSSDTFFDLSLKGYKPGEEPVPGKLRPQAREVTEMYRFKHYVGKSVRIPDGYLDGGRRSQIDDEGNVRSGRELMLVDRNRDPVLQQHLKFARSTELRALSPADRASVLAVYIHRRMLPPEGVDRDTALNMLTSEYQDREMLLGEAETTGVCRHQSLLFKILGDEAGLAVAMVRGNFVIRGQSMPHAWNEVELEGGRKLLVDVAYPPQAYFNFPEITHDYVIRNYLNPLNQPLYGQKLSGN